MPETLGREEFKRGLIEHISTLVRAKRRLEQPISIDESTPLFSSGLVDSLGILELMAYVEESTGRAITVANVNVRNFATVERICQRFWHEEVRR
jgi:acyl carrier protein